MLAILVVLRHCHRSFRSFALRLSRHHYNLCPQNLSNTDYGSRARSRGGGPSTAQRLNLSLRVLQRRGGILLPGHALPEGIAQDFLLPAGISVRAD